MIDYFRDIEYPALGYVFSVAAINSSSIGGTSKGEAAISAAAMLSGTDANFQSISGIKATRSTESYQPLGMNNYNFQLPTTTSYEDLVLERGVVKTFSDFTIWCNSFINRDTYDLTSLRSSNNALTKKIILVFLWDRNKIAPLMTWTFYDAFPKSIEYASISAKDNSYAVEKITIAYSHFTTTPNPAAPI